MLGFCTSIAIACLNVTDKFIIFAIDLVEVVVGQLTPLLLYFTLELVLLPFHFIPIHCPYLRLVDWSLFKTFLLHTHKRNSYI
jgi:hypothetical protein